MAGPEVLLISAPSGHNQLMARGRMGSNQYRRLSVTDLSEPKADLMSMAAASTHRRRCGNMWNTGCRAWVEPPDYSHAEHGVRDRRGQNLRWPGCPTSVLEHMGNHGTWYARSLVASNLSCPEYLLQHLARDTVWQVRQKAAANHRTPASTLLRLSHDTQQPVRVEVAGNPNCPQDMLRQLFVAGDPKKLIREHLAKNTSCPIDILEYLLHRGGWMTRMRASLNPASAPLLPGLAASGDARVRARAADNPACPVELLRQLAGDPHHRVRQAVAQHPNCPLDLLVKMAQDPHFQVVQSCLEHPNFPEEYRALLPVI